jgi:hypothetical protein
MRILLSFLLTFNGLFAQSVDSLFIPTDTLAYSAFYHPNVWVHDEGTYLYAPVSYTLQITQPTGNETHTLGLPYCHYARAAWAVANRGWLVEVRNPQLELVRSFTPTHPFRILHRQGDYLLTLGNYDHQRRGYWVYRFVE